MVSLKAFNNQITKSISLITNEIRGVFIIFNNIMTLYK